MFELFKKKKPTTDPVQAVIDEMMLYGQPFRQYIEKMDIVDDEILQLQMRIFESDDTAELEKQYHSAQRRMARPVLTTTPHSPILSKPIIPPKKPMPPLLSMMSHPPSQQLSSHSCPPIHALPISSLWLQVKAVLANPQQR